MQYFKKMGLMVLVGFSLMMGSPLYAADEVPAADCAGTPCKAEGGTKTEQYLFCIRQYTNCTLSKVNTLPQYIVAALDYFTSWSDTKETDQSIVPDLQTNLTSLTDNYQKNVDAQTALQKPLLTRFFVKPNDNTPLTQKELQNANDLTYQTLLNPSQPFWQQDPRKTDQGEPPIDSALNYIYNTSAITVSHVLPNPVWLTTSDPSDTNRPIQYMRYSNYYNTISAVQTYNGYLLSELYANQQNKFALNDVQKKLVDQVSSSEWTTQVGTDALGLVFRHILLFDSQIFVLLARMLDVQKQMLTTQAMTNSLLVLLNLSNEDMLVKKADGTLKLP